MGLLDYYRQFDDMSESEVNERLREKRAQEKALALEQVPLLDLSGTEWPELPSADVVSASVYEARGRLNGYPDRNATQLRRLLAERHNVKAEQIVVGNGAVELMQTAVYLLTGGGDEVIVPWPSYGLYPTIAARAGARLVAVDLERDAVDPAAVLANTSDRSRVLMLCNPNDPTGTYMDSEHLGSTLAALPEHVHVLLDEALIQFQGVEPEDSCLKLVEAFPRLLVFRTFSKIYGLSGLRSGYVVGSPQASSLLAALAPSLGVNALTQAATIQALKVGGQDVARRRETVLQERRRLIAGASGFGVEFSDSQANFVWLRAPGLTGDQLATRLEESNVRVARGGPLGDEDHVRVAIRSGAATDRFIWVLGQALG